MKGSRFLPYLVLPLLGALGYYVMFSPTEPVTYRDVVVSVRQIEANEPDTVVKWRDRIRWLTPEPEVAAHAPGGAESDVAAFCAPDTILRVDTLPGRVDTIWAAPDPRLLIRSFSLDEAWFFRSDRLTVTGPMNTGDLWQLSYPTRGDVSVRAHADSLIVRTDRWWWVKDAAQTGTCLLGGFAIGRVF